MGFLIAAALRSFRSDTTSEQSYFAGAINLKLTFLYLVARKIDGLMCSGN